MTTTSENKSKDESKKDNNDVNDTYRDYAY